MRYAPYTEASGGVGTGRPRSEGALCEHYCQPATGNLRLHQLSMKMETTKTRHNFCPHEDFSETNQQ